MSEPSLNFRGAVDLSVITQSTPAPAKGGKPGLVLEVTVATFNEVIQQSTQYPILVELYSGRTLGNSELTDRLVKVVNEADGKLLLARVDVDTNAQILQVFGAQSVPTTFAVIGGQPIPLFQGTPTVEQVDQVVAEVLKVAEQNGVTGRVEGIEDTEEVADDDALPPHLAAAYQAINDGDLAQARSIYEEALKQDPNDAESVAGLAQVALMERLEGVDPVQVLQQAEDDPSDVEGQLAAADLEVGSGNHEAGFARLIAVIRRTSGDDRDQARERLLELFTLFPSGDSIVLRTRRDLASALF